MSPLEKLAVAVTVVAFLWRYVQHLATVDRRTDDRRSMDRFECRQAALRQTRRCDP